jgi:hypothetical protein
VREWAVGYTYEAEAAGSRDDDGDPVTASRLRRRGYRVLRLGDAHVVLAGDGRRILFTREAE